MKPLTIKHSPTTHYAPIAQSAQLQHALYKYGKPLSKMLLFTDLDEYVNRDLNELVVAHPNYTAYMFLNNWCDTIEVPEDLVAYRKDLETSEFPASFYRDKRIWSINERAKNLINTDKLEAIKNIHNISSDVYSEPDMVIQHFFRWSPAFVDHGDRTRESVGFIDYLTIDLSKPV
jgi:hypothetical protein